MFYDEYLDIICNRVDSKGEIYAVAATDVSHEPLFAGTSYTVPGC